MSAAMVRAELLTPSGGRIRSFGREVPGQRTRTFPLPIEQMQISKELLARLVTAIAEFWQMVGYLYNESIDAKHWSLESKLCEQRLCHAAAVAHLNSVVACTGSDVP